MWRIRNAKIRAIDLWFLHTYTKWQVNQYLYTKIEVCGKYWNTHGWELDNCPKFWFFGQNTHSWELDTCPSFLFFGHLCPSRLGWFSATLLPCVILWFYDYGFKPRSLVCCWVIRLSFAVLVVGGVRGFFVVFFTSFTSKLQAADCICLTFSICF